MIITITSGVGYGKTLLSAFDGALKDAGTHNYNLIRLSSVIPPDSNIKLKKFKSNPDNYGDRLYIVKADMRSRESGKYIGAAIGWYQLPDGRGVFVEHEEIGETKSSVESNLTEDIRKSLSDLCKIRNYQATEKDFKMKMIIAKVKNSPAAVLVIAVYKSDPW